MERWGTGEGIHYHFQLETIYGKSFSAQTRKTLEIIWFCRNFHYAQKSIRISIRKMRTESFCTPMKTNTKNKSWHGLEMLVLVFSIYRNAGAKNGEFCLTRARFLRLTPAIHHLHIWITLDSRRWNILNSKAVRKYLMKNEEKLCAHRSLSTNRFCFNQVPHA